ncbi:TPA: CaiF/GrlA family transcriptional regulator [Serratia marcescens]|uniref:CaiF/GrlA family transcriptional regulator n=1 Tax=Serratia marcescens TaxID=615 RepID=UPI00301E1048
MPSEKGASIPPRQSNYESYVLPTLVVGLGLEAEPLYLVAAYWGWRLGRPFCREELAVAFGISLHRAGDVMSYIRRMRPERVCSRQHYERPQKGIRKRYLLILSEPTMGGATPARESDKTASSVVTTDPQARVALQALRRWFLGRPNPPDMT